MLCLRLGSVALLVKSSQVIAWGGNRSLNCQQTHTHTHYLDPPSCSWASGCIHNAFKWKSKSKNSRDWGKRLACEGALKQNLDPCDRNKADCRLEALWIQPWQMVKLNSATCFTSFTYDSWCTLSNASDFLEKLNIFIFVFSWILSQPTPQRPPTFPTNV